MKSNIFSHCSSKLEFDCGWACSCVNCLTPGVARGTPHVDDAQWKIDFDYPREVWQIVAETDNDSACPLVGRCTA